MKKFLPMCVVALAATLVIANPAFASSTSTSLPWESAMDKLKDSLTGPYATAIVLIGLVVSGSLLLFGSDLNGIWKSVVQFVLVASLILCAAQVITHLFSTGAVVAAVEQEERIVCLTNQPCEQ